MVCPPPPHHYTADITAYDRREAYTVLVVYIWMHACRLGNNTDDSTIVIGWETQYYYIMESYYSAWNVYRR